MAVCLPFLCLCPGIKGLLEPPGQRAVLGTMPTARGRGSAGQLADSGGPEAALDLQASPALLPAPGTCPLASSALVTGVRWDTMAPSVRTSQVPHISISVASRLCPRSQRSGGHAELWEDTHRAGPGWELGRPVPRTCERTRFLTNLQRARPVGAEASTVSAKSTEDKLSGCVSGREPGSEKEGGTQWGVGGPRKSRRNRLPLSPFSHPRTLSAPFLHLRCLPSHRLHDDCRSAHGRSSVGTGNSGFVLRTRFKHSVPSMERVLTWRTRLFEVSGGVTAQQDTESPITLSRAVLLKGWSPDLLQMF